MSSSNSNGEENRVGQAHHKKTRSRCSIDWSIPNDDFSKFMTDSPDGLQQRQEGRLVVHSHPLSLLSMLDVLEDMMPRLMRALLVVLPSVYLGAKE